MRNYEKGTFSLRQLGAIMLEISISVEGQLGLQWAQWKRLVPAIEQLGFASLFLSDHFDTSGSADANALEMILALTYLADHTNRVRIGSLVASLSFRDPIMLARQAAALNNLSGGRMILGVGAGWVEDEHTMFGYHLGSLTTRMDRFAEGLAVITGLLRHDEPLTYAGQFYHVQNGVLAGPRQPSGPPILIGGTGRKRTLPLVARYADIWNATQLNAVEFREHSQFLDRLLVAAGRAPASLKRTLCAPVFVGRDETELEQRGFWLRSFNPDWADTPITSIFETLRPRIKSLTWGTPAEVVQHFHQYAEAGVEEFIVQWGAFDDLDGLKLLAEQVLPHMTA
jgi:alkanesulfonate monooxygenase SsuD/methylene tetrahydromethanopterin reductase-like flavin-dependent oxidoreductase (luciferase family)